MNARILRLKNVNAAFGLTERIKAEPDATAAGALFRSNLRTLAELTRPLILETCKALAQKTGEPWERLYGEITVAREQQADSNDSRAAIKVGNEQFADISSAIVTELRNWNAREPELFRYGGGIVSIRVDEKSRAIIHRHDVITLRGLIARRMRFVSYKADGEPVNVPPPRDVIEDVLKNSGDAFPVLNAITGTPILHADGSIYAICGYDPDTRLYFCPEPGFQLPPIPDRPTRADAIAAREYIDGTLFKDFPYAAEADRANAHAALMTVYMRAVEGFTTIRLPMFVVDAPKGGHGKTLLACAVAASATGHTPEISGLPESEAETRKAFTALLAEGCPVIVLDNAAGALRSPSIARLFTAPLWKDRILCESKNFVGANNSIWFVTGSNIGFSSEIARRVVRIRLDAKMAHPEERTDISEERNGMDKFQSWIKANRGAICGAVLTIIKSWIVAGRPRAEVRPVGSFEIWAQTTGDILAFAGVNGFLRNVEQLRADSDEETAEWEPLLSWASRLFPATPFDAEKSGSFRAAELVDKLQDGFAELLPDIGRDGRDGDSVNNTDNWNRYKKSFGRALKRKTGTRYGRFGLRFEHIGKCGHTGQPFYVVAGDLAGLHAHIQAALGQGAENEK